MTAARKLPTTANICDVVYTPDWLAADMIAQPFPPPRLQGRPW